MARLGPQQLNPPSNLRGKVAKRLIDYTEDLISAQSIHGDPPVYRVNDFPWALSVESRWPEIRKELDQVLKRRSELPAFSEISSQVETITNDELWKVYIFYGFGQPCDENIRSCPKTCEILQQIPNLKTAFFSILAPGKQIPPHRGLYNGVLRYHLGLKVPEDVKNCKIRIDDTLHYWQEGKSLIFDDSYDHQVWNNTDEERVVLFVDFVRPCKAFANFINQAVLKTAVLTPFVKEAKENARNWSQKYHNNKQKKHD